MARAIGALSEEGSKLVLSDSLTQSCLSVRSAASLSSVCDMLACGTQPSECYRNASRAMCRIIRAFSSSERDRQ
nr:hypothetical protein CFP56_21552 [Quercus suber]